VFVSFSVPENNFARARASNLKLKQKKEIQIVHTYSFGRGNIPPLFFASFVFQILLDTKIEEPTKTSTTSTPFFKKQKLKPISKSNHR